MINLTNLSKHYIDGTKVITALDSISLRADVNEFIAITGASGSGKSTLLNILSGNDRATAGEFFLDGRDTDAFDDEDWVNLRKNQISMVYQDYRLIEEYTVRENIELALSLVNNSNASLHERADELIKTVGLENESDRQAKLLSGGQKQRVSIARALANDPMVILADEPTANLDEKNAAEIVKLLKSISTNKLLIVVTHNFDIFKDTVSRHISLSDGKITEDETFKSSKPAIKKEQPAKSSVKNRGYAFLRHNKNGVRLFFSLLFVTIITLTIFSFSLNSITVSSGYYTETPFFSNLDEDRYILTKVNGSTFSDSDIELLLKDSNTYDVIKSDPVLDYEAYFYDSETRHNLYVRILPISHLSINLTKGSLPVSDDQIIFSTHEGFGFLGYTDPTEAHELTVNGNGTYDVKIVGWAASGNEFIDDIYVSDSLFKQIYADTFCESCEKTLFVDIFSSAIDTVCVSANIPRGSVLFVGDEYSTISSNATISFSYLHGECKLSDLSVTTSSAYPKVYEYYDTVGNAAIVSLADVNELLDNNCYQISVFSNKKMVTDNNYYVIYPNAVNRGQVDSKYIVQVAIWSLIFIILSMVLSLVVYLFFKRSSKSEVQIIAIRKMLGESVIDGKIFALVRCLIPALGAFIVSYALYFTCVQISKSEISTGLFILLSNIPTFAFLSISLIISLGISVLVFRNIIKNVYFVKEASK